MDYGGEPRLYGNFAQKIGPVAPGEGRYRPGGNDSTILNIDQFPNNVK
jgi:hypothetical protein